MSDPGLRPDPVSLVRQPLGRVFFDRPAEEVAPELLGRVLVSRLAAGTVELRITEVEAYGGGLDPASHAFRGPTARNGVMFGQPGHVYVYFTYGMHFCANLVTGPGTFPSAVLLRAGEVVSGRELARSRRSSSKTDADLARGPARLTRALGLDRAFDGADACAPEGQFGVVRGTPCAPSAVRQGPRTGVSTAAETPWRFWIADDPSVSPYRRHTPKRPRPAGRP